jgi:hypothetical protein
MKGRDFDEADDGSGEYVVILTATLRLEAQASRSGSSAAPHPRRPPTQDAQPSPQLTPTGAAEPIARVRLTSRA